MEIIYNYNHLISELKDIENDYLSRSSTIDKSIDDLSKIFEDTYSVIKMRIPEKVLITDKTSLFSSKRYYFFCNNCKEELPYKQCNYCPNCGQALYLDFYKELKDG